MVSKIRSLVVLCFALAVVGCAGPQPATQSSASPPDGWLLETFVWDGKEVAGIADPNRRWKIGLISSSDQQMLVVLDTRTGWKLNECATKGYDSVLVRANDDDAMFLLRMGSETIFTVANEKKKASIFNYHLTSERGTPWVVYSGLSEANESIGYMWYDLDADGQFDIRHEPDKSRWIHCGGGWVYVIDLDYVKGWAKDDKGAEYKFDAKKGAWIRQ